MNIKIELVIILFLSFAFFSVLSCKRSIWQSDLTVDDIDSLRFRRSYVGFQNWLPNEIEFMESRDPDIEYGQDSLSQVKLKRLGLMNKDSLVLAKFQHLDSFTLSSNSTDTIRGYAGYSKGYLNYSICLTDRKDSVKIELKEDIQEVKFAFIDFIPGGFPEIAVLRNYYIMNGDNYYIHIYQVRR